MNPGAAFPFGLILSTPFALIALGIVPLIVVLHSLSLKWRNVEVSSLQFWDALLKEKRTSIRLRSILRSLILLAQLLAAALLALALAQPLISRTSLSGSGNVILVLDVTASMQTVEGGRQRMEEAKAKALEVLPRLRPGSRMCVIAAARSPRILAPFTADRRRLGRAIRSAAATDEAGDMKESLLFALSLRDPKRDDRVVLVTDGAFDSLGDLDEGKPWISLIRVGESGSNAAITAFALRRNSGPDGGYEMFVKAQNFSTRSMSFPLEVSAGGNRIYRTDVLLGPGEERGISAPYEGLLPIEGQGGRSAAAVPGGINPGAAPRAVGAAVPEGRGDDSSDRVVAEIGARDDLAADNRSYAVLARARGLKAQIIGQGNFFLEKALATLPNVIVSVVQPASVGLLGPAPDQDSTPAPSAGPEGKAGAPEKVPEEVGNAASGGAVNAALDEAWNTAAEQAVNRSAVFSPNADVVVFDGVEAPALEKGNYILIGTVAPNLPLTAAGTIANPTVTSWDASHPLLFSVSVESIQIREALRVEARGFRTLVSSGDRPLMMIYQREGLKVLFIAFRLDGSDLPLRPAFPVLLANALEWFSPGWLSVQAEQTQAGEPRELPSDGSLPVVVKRPDGVREAVPSGESPSVFRNTMKAGFYEAVWGGESLDFAVTLSSPEESDVTPRFAFSRSGEAGSDVHEISGVSLTPLWGILALAAVALILAEWVLVVRERK